MRTKKELAVVIGCVVFLLATLGLVGDSGRRRAKEMVCLSNLRQWYDVFMMFAEDNGGYFMGGRNVYGQNWWAMLEPYYVDRNLLLCPMAKDPYKNPWEGCGNFGTWGPTWFPDGFYGSYGMNDWACNPTGQLWIYGDKRKFWRSANVSGRDTIPLLGDALWDVGWPGAEDMPPIYPGWVEFIAGEDMGQWAILRHGARINMLFMDGSVKKIHIRDLWYLNWHRLSFQELDQAPSFEDFPLWMQNL